MTRTRILHIALFLVGLVLLDRLLGSGLAALAARVDTGQSLGLANRALAQRDAEILIFGSSRARRHIDPRVLEERLGARSYNTGCPGQGLAYARLLQALVLERGSEARLFVLQADPLDLYLDLSSRAALFSVYWGESPVVDAFLADQSRFARWKLASHVYRYNSLLPAIVANLFTSIEEDMDGFMPHVGHMGPARIRALAERERRTVASSQPLLQLEQHLRGFLAAARQARIRVLLISGPRFPLDRPLPPWEHDGQARLGALAAADGAVYRPLDERTQSRFHDPTLYADSAHLNARGARLFSELVADEIARLKLWQR